jgi:hypothetical protein
LSFCITPSVFSNIYLSYVLCILCCQFLWIVLFHYPFCLTLGTQDTGQIHFREYRRGNTKEQSRETGNIAYTWHRTNKWYSLTFICPMSCVSYVASFSRLSFFITPSVFSNMYLSCVMCTQCCQFLLNGGNEKGQSRETGNIEYTRHRKNKC